MKIAIAGAGAMGSRFGCCLFEAGNELLLIDGWKENVQQMEERGLYIHTEIGEKVSMIPCTTPEKSVGEFDLLLIFTKALQTKEMISNCKHLINNKTLVLTLQNGLGNVEAIEQFVPRERLYAGVTTYAANMLGPGEIEALGSGVTEIMQIDGNEETEVNKIVNVFNEAGIITKLSTNVLYSIWNKVAFNAVLNPLCTIMKNTVATVGGYSQIEDVVNGILDEIIEVAFAEGIVLSKKEIIKLIFGVFDPKMSGHHYSSMYQDLFQKFRKTEIEYLNGAIVQKGMKHNIEVPNNKLISHLICMLEETNCIFP